MRCASASLAPGTLVASPTLGRSGSKVLALRRFLWLWEESWVKAKAWVCSRTDDGDALGRRYLLEGVILSHFPPLVCAFRAKALTMSVGRRRRLLRRSLLGGDVLETLLEVDGIVAELCSNSSGPGGGRQLSSDRSCFCACLRLFHPPRPGCKGCRLADALPPLFVGGCFAAVVVLVVDCFGRMLFRLGSSVGWMLCHLRVWRPLASLAMVFI